MKTSKFLTFRRLAAVLTCMVFSNAELRSAVVNVIYNTVTDVPVTATSVAGGDTVSFALTFAPPVGTELMVVKNTGLPFLSGTFANLTQGQTVTMNFGGISYQFVANYYGGTGNDLVLVWANTARPFAWGHNNSGQIGDNTITINSIVPSPVTNTGTLASKTVLALSGGQEHSLAMNSDGTLAAWGKDLHGELGGGLFVNSKVPVMANISAVPATDRLVAISAGERFNLALTSSGKVLSWGYNFAGQLGNGTYNGVATPQFVPTSGALNGQSLVAIAAGFAHSLVLSSTGTVYGWGQTGAVGANSNASSILVPVPVYAGGVLAGKTVVAIAAGWNHSLALCSDGTLVSWGFNHMGQLGTSLSSGTFTPLLPVLVNTAGALAGKTVVAISAGGHNSAALCSDGTVATWGENSLGQLGNNSTSMSNVPIDISGYGVLAGKTVTRIAAGHRHTIALCSDGTVTAWGYNGLGQYGNNSSSSSLVPVAINTSTLGNGSRITAIYTGSHASHCLAVVANLPVPVPGPQMHISGNGVMIPNGDTMPNINDNTDFSDVDFCGNTSITNIYTIVNNGDTSLMLTGSPFVELTGSSDFTWTQPSLSTIPAGGQTTFSVTFSPTTVGLHTALISIASDDSSVSPYNFTIQGMGGGPEIDVTGGGSGIADGSTSPSTNNGTNFGAVTSQVGAPVVQTYTITNNGNAPLTGISVSGTNPGDFDVSDLTPNVTSLLPGEWATFTVTFLPLGVGTCTATITIGNSDCDEGPYEFDIQGEGLCNNEPEIAVSGLGQNIVDGSAVCNTSDDTQFGAVPALYGLPVTHTFTITNSGTTTLSVSSITVSPSGAFTVTQLPYTVAIGNAPGTSTMTFQVTFQPATVGMHTATVEILSDDSDESPFTFMVCGTGREAKKAKIEVSGNSTPILDGDPSPIPADHTRFPNTVWNGNITSTRIFTITNTGGSPLTINNLGTNPNTEFKIANSSLSTLPITIAPNNGTATFQVTFNPTSGNIFNPNGNMRSCWVNIQHSVTSAPYTFKVEGLRTIGMIDHSFDVIGDKRPIAYGDSSPTLLDRTNFGKLPVGDRRTYTYTIRNSGKIPLKLGKVSAMAMKSDAGEFTVQKQPAKSVPAGKYTTFKLQFMPSNVGPSTSHIKIPFTDESSGADEKMANFEFMVKGTGAKSLVEQPTQ